MTASSVSVLTDQLRDILMQERDLLRSGYPVESISLVEEKTEIMAKLGPIVEAWERGEVAGDEIESLQEVISLAQENALRFNAVRNGLRSLIERMSELKSGTQIGAYDQTGNQMQFRRTTGSYKKSI